MAHFGSEIFWIVALALMGIIAVGLMLRGGNDATGGGDHLHLRDRDIKVRAGNDDEAKP